jgi:hypothetical protein
MTNSSTKAKHERRQRHGDRDERVALAEQVDETCIVLKARSDEIVYSPRTSAIASTDADRMPPRMFGTMTWTIVRTQPAPRLLDASDRVAVSIDRRLASIAR